jgi:hypothetical protein
MLTVQVIILNETATRRDNSHPDEQWPRRLSQENHRLHDWQNWGGFDGCNDLMQNHLRDMEERHYVTVLYSKWNQLLI